MNEDAQGAERSGPSITDGYRKPKTARQEDILLAYAATPNAAAVARALETHERHVRRIVAQHPEHLSELRLRARRERQLQRYAREAMLEQWSDEAIARCLRMLQTFEESETEHVALKALKMEVDIALRIRREVGLDIVAALDDVEAALRRIQGVDGVGTGAES